ncbi:tetratricopeptide repeat protein [Phenylobacterium sp.]|jgi:tetratricopeptide (TPR) repeat protein|uniref:tetratricopeptide repeat protein n=1 Tax=Phenylobacterium sp. TaxID=1871053 RepID=UPI002F400A0B
MSDPAALHALCQQGLTHHQAGRLAEAAQAYEQVLAADPGHFDALQFLGVQRIQTGRLDEAVELLRRAIAVRADAPGVFGNLANALNGLRRFEEAAHAADRALALNPSFAEAHGNRGQALRALGRLDEAAASYARAAELGPTPQAHFNTATTLRELGALDAALAACDRATALDPAFVEAWRSRAIVLGELGRPGEALESFDRALTLRPGYAEAWAGRGNVLSGMGRHAEALESFDRALAARPDFAEALANRAAPLRSLDRAGEALADAERALALRPDHAEAHVARGGALYDLRRLDEALASYDRALALEPQRPEVHDNRAVVLHELRRLDEAMAGYDRAIALRPTFAEAQHHQAMCRLMLGDFAAGWAQYEWRWATEQLGWDRSPSPAPVWLGEGEVVGRRVLVRAEQGLGDTLQFCRYVRDLAARGAAVTLAVQPGLERLLARLEGVVQAPVRGAPLPPHDLQVPLMSLPLALGAGAPGGQPYLSADRDAAAAWAARLADAPGLRVGLCWAGGVRPGQFVADRIDRRRSLPLEAFAPLADIPGLTLYSLQKGPPAARLADLQGAGWAGPAIVDPTGELADFADTAALVAALDLVITCDTAVAHLAGALGRPVWVLNRFDACWRWLDGRDDSPWYETARLFRQPTPGDWDSVIARVREALAGLAAGR